MWLFGGRGRSTYVPPVVVERPRPEHQIVWGAAFEQPDPAPVVKWTGDEEGDPPSPRVVDEISAAAERMLDLHYGR